AVEVAGAGLLGREARDRLAAARGRRDRARGRERLRVMPGARVDTGDAEEDGLALAAVRDDGLGVERLLEERRGLVRLALLDVGAREIAEGLGAPARVRHLPREVER